MLVSVKVNNCYIYDSETELSLRADMRQKRFSTNVISDGGVNAVKSVVIFGPNNVGKTNFVRCINGIRSILLNQGIGLAKNLFSQKNLTEFSVEFTEEGKLFLFDVKLQIQPLEFLYERMIEASYDKYGNRKEKTLYVRDNINQTYQCEDNNLSNLMGAMAGNNLLFYLLDTKQFELLGKAKRVITSFASKIDVVDMNNIPIKKTIDMMKMTTEEQKKVSDFVVSADLAMDDFRYLSDDEVRGILEKVKGDGEAKPQENAITASAPLAEMLHLASVYHGISVPSVLFDSAGTKKIASLAGYVIDALEKGHILVVDELDNSLHSKLTRAIISLFNNELNKEAQLICTTHDVTLLDIKKMFRKEQIWFAHKDEEGVFLYSLAEFTADKDGVRDTSDLIEKYKAGVFGAIPEPDLFSTLQEVCAGA